MNRSVTMRDVRKILKLYHESKMSKRKIGEACSCSKNTVSSVLARAEKRDLTWPLPPELTDEDLERMIYPSKDTSVETTPIDMSYIHTELSRKGVTRQLLWAEYCDNAPNPVGYSRFCHLYYEWKKKLSAVMRQDHKAGEKLYVDWAGMTELMMNLKLLI